jgi:hypothetical protein
VGGLSVGWIMGMSRTPADATPLAGVGQAGSSPSPSPSLGAAGPSPSPVASAPRVNVDPLAASALRQVASTDAQLNGFLATLKHELRKKSVDTGAVSATLRSISATATYGASVVGYLTAWPDAATLQGQLGGFYAQIRAVAADGLSNELANRTAYASAAKQMVAVLAALPAQRAAEFELGHAGGVDLPGAPSPTPSPAPSS